MYHLLQNIGLMALLLFCALLHPQKASANSGSGDIGAVLFNPLLVDLKEAQKFCEEEPQAVKCDILLERLKEKKQSDTLTTVEQRPFNNSYNIYSANFQ